MKLRTIVGEAVRSLGATMSTTVAATLTVLIGMFVLGVSIALGTWVLSWSDHVKNQLEVKAYMCVQGYDGCTANATAQDINYVRGLLVQYKSQGRVKSVKFLSPNDVLAINKKRQPTLTQQLSSNPFSAEFDIIPTKAEYNAGIRSDLLAAGPSGTKPTGLDFINDGGATSRRILHIGSIVEIVFLVGLIVLLIASTLLIANTIRLSIFARRREIEVMKLVGASNWFVRGPFMVEGLLCGIGGSVLAVFLLLIGKVVVLPAILGHIKDSKDVHAMGFELIALLMIAAGLMLGAAGSGLTVRRFLRV
jgi:cell division transport system permease protein